MISLEFQKRYVNNKKNNFRSASHPDLGKKMVMRFLSSVRFPPSQESSIMYDWIAVRTRFVVLEPLQKL